MLPVLRIQMRISAHEKLDPDPHQSQKQDPDHFDEEQDGRIRNCFKKIGSGSVSAS
jgi:hypothetical protein